MNIGNNISNKVFNSVNFLRTELMYNINNQISYSLNLSQSNIIKLVINNSVINNIAL
jgi:predicted XRE-type DNA-binding protein